MECRCCLLQRRDHVVIVTGFFLFCLQCTERRDGEKNIEVVTADGQRLYASSVMHLNNISL